MHGYQRSLVLHTPPSPHTSCARRQSETGTLTSYLLACHIRQRDNKHTESVPYGSTAVNTHIHTHAALRTNLRHAALFIDNADAGGGRLRAPFLFLFGGVLERASKLLPWPGQQNNCWVFAEPHTETSTCGTAVDGMKLGRFNRRSACCVRRRHFETLSSCVLT